MKPFVRFLLSLVLLASPLSIANEVEPWVKDAAGVVLGGYDVVAYFELDQAEKGNKRWSVEWQGGQWWFSSQHHQQLFVAQPERYLPAFAGYCANGLSDGHLIEANPEHFRIIDDQLYLYYSSWGRLQWSIGVDQKIEAASSWWRQLKPDQP